MPADIVFTAGFGRTTALLPLRQAAGARDTAMQTIDQQLPEAPVVTPNASVIQRTDTDPRPRPSGRPCVVVVGAGFGGLQVAAKLAHADVDVLVLDRNNYH